MNLCSQIHNLRSKHLLEKVCEAKLYISWSTTTFMLGTFLESKCIMAKKWWKVGKNKKISILLSYENFQIQNPNFQNWFAWWTRFIFWHILMNYDPWHLILTKKSKFDFLVYSWLQNSSVNPMNLRSFELCN